MSHLTVFAPLEGEEALGGRPLGALALGAMALAAVGIGLIRARAAAARRWP